MTQPSYVLAAIIDAMQLELQPASPSIDTPAVMVRAQPELGDDLDENLTIPMPAVLVSCTGMTDVSNDGAPMMMSAHFMARCYARSSDPLVAMDLAAVVARLVDASLWLDGSGEATTVRRADNIRISNRTALAQLERGHVLWTVGWTQRLELTSGDVALALADFRKLHITYTMGADAPDETQMIYPRGTP